MYLSSCLCVCAVFCKAVFAPLMWLAAYFRAWSLVYRLLPQRVVCTHIWSNALSLLFRRFSTQRCPCWGLHCCYWVDFAAVLFNCLYCDDCFGTRLFFILWNCILFRLLDCGYRHTHIRASIDCGNLIKRFAFVWGLGGVVNGWRQFCGGCFVVPVVWMDNWDLSWRKVLIGKFVLKDMLRPKKLIITSLKNFHWRV